VPTQIAAPVSASHNGSGPSFKKEIQPILAANCASCHNSGQVGAAHWTFDTAGDATKVAEGIGTVVKAKYMPPWPASSVGVPLVHSKALDQKQIDLITSWSAAGGKLDESASAPVKPTPGPAGPKPRRDIVMRMPQAYAGSLSVPNDYRCFVLDPHITQPTFVTGFEVTPDQIQEIHHAQIFHVNAAQAQNGQEISGQDGKPGFQCYGTVSLRGGRSTSLTPPSSGPKPIHLGGFGGQAGLIAGWVPGQDPTQYGNGSGILMEPGDEVVLQLHYHYDKTPTPDRTTVALQTAPGTAKLKQVAIVNPLGPVEIPCMPGVVAPLCDRNAAIADDARLYGGIGSAAESGLLLLCGKTPEELTAGFNGVAHTTCDSRVPADGTMIGAMGHMHTLGKSFRLTLDPGTPQQKVLLDIPTWNFDWQMNYGFQTPIHVKAGETIEMSCTWDRSLDPNRAPKYIVFAEGTEDEMCFSTYALIPDNQ
jgi:hypothetical protein